MTHFVVGLVAIVLGVVLTTVGGYLAKDGWETIKARRQEAKPKDPLKSSGTPLVIHDVLRTVYPRMQLDFRIGNPSPNEVSVSRVLLLIVDIELGDSPIGKQEPSDTAQIEIHARLHQGDVIQAPLSLNLKPGENDRFLVDVRWAGQPQSVGQWYTALPAIQTSSGFVQGPLVRIHLQQSIWPTAPEYAGRMASWDVPEGASIPQVDWAEAVKRALPSGTP
jgi:hypothetical protein